MTAKQTTTPSTEQQEQHYTLGIAGHIDHGKTTLTEALTGKQTDRLKEEQERHISIEVGYASFPLSTGENVGVVDVPGHERFIRQMVAGVAGIDLVLLVIAADEGVMPQTKEHLDILHLLGVNKGLIVLTKADTVEEEFIELVREQVEEETENTFLAHSPILVTDSVSGRGIEALQEEIEKAISTVPSRPIQGIARLPIDRVFPKKGFGTVVTGTLYQGKVSVGDELEILPSGKKVRVRHVQVHGSDQPSAYAGQRVALNLSGIDHDELHRGNVLATQGSIESTTRMDIEFQMLEDLDFALKQRSPIRVHIGTSEVLGRIIFFDRNECLPGQTVLAQVECEAPVAALFEDRFILRRPTPMTTLGGGMVIDPYAPKHRFGQQTIEDIAAKKEGDLATRAQHILDKDGLQPVQQLTHQLGVSLTDWEEAIENTEDVGLKKIAGETQTLTFITTQTDWQQRWQEIQHELKAYHEQYPLREGIDRKQLKSTYFPSLTAAQWNVILMQAEEEQWIKVKNEAVSLPDFESGLSEEEQQLWEQLKTEMHEAGIEVPLWDELMSKAIPKVFPKAKTRDNVMSAEAQTDFQRWLIRHEYMIPLEEDRFMPAALYEQSVQKLKDQTDDSFTIKDVREVFDTSRKYLIPFLESLDKNGYTKREDNVRIWKN